MDFSMKEFMKYVGDKNWFFSVLKESSLEPLIAALGGPYNEMRGDDFRTLSAEQLFRVKKAMLAIPAVKVTKYKLAIQYLTNTSKRLRDIISAEMDVNRRVTAIHEDGRFATVVVEDPPGARGAKKYRFFWHRGAAIEREGYFLWNPNEKMTGWIQATPERGGMGPFMLHFQAAVICRRKGEIHMGTPATLIAHNFFTASGFTQYHPPPADPLNVNWVEVERSSGHASTIATRTKLKCRDWTFEA